jgi:adenylate kinase family enzyme
MPLIYITGPTGSGKSTICQELQSLGYEAYDTDDEGIRYWINKESGKPVEVRTKSVKHGHKWFSEHTVGLSSDWMENLKSKSDKEDKNIYICGITENDLDFVSSYSKVIILNIDEDIQHQRLINGTNSKYGKEPKQLSAAIKWRQSQIDKYKNAGAYEIDATLPVANVIKEILAATS